MSLPEIVDMHRRMNSFERIFRAHAEFIDALNHARNKNQRLPNIDGASPDSLAKRWSQVKGVGDLQHRLTRFNIFTALNAMDYETRHSNFLAWLLDPNGTHGFGTKFLSGFLSLITRQMPSTNDKVKLNELLRSPKTLATAEVEREFKPAGWSGGRADLLIVERGQKFVCLVENKIHTGEHSEQLSRYRRMVEQEFPGFQHLFVFLTLRIEAPSDSAYLSLTYAELCGELKLLTDVRETVPPTEALALLFQQYVDFIVSFESGAKPRPNAFSALRLREIKHSDFFAWLFNFRETHGLSISPFAEFLHLVRQKKPGVKTPDLNTGDWEVSREVYNIDLLLVSERAKFVCLIENKLEAREGKDQLQRYKAFVREWYPGFEAVFVFFTLRDDEPTDSDYVPMRFSEFTPYLKKTLKSLPHHDWTDAQIVAVLLDHYRALLNDRLSLRLKTRVELAPEMAKSCDGLFQREGALIPAILSGVRDWQENVRQEMEEFLGELIAHSFGKDCFRPDRTCWPKNYRESFLPFVPGDLDAIRSLTQGGADSAYQGQIFTFEFVNLPFTNPFQNEEPLGITLRAGMKKAKPGYHELRETIYQLTKENRALFNSANKERVGDEKGVCLVLSQTLCTAKDFRRLELTAVKEKLERRFQRFVKHQYPAILKLLRHPSVARFEA